MLIAAAAIGLLLTGCNDSAQTIKIKRLREAIDRSFQAANNKLRPEVDSFHDGYSVWSDVVRDLDETTTELEAATREADRLLYDIEHPEKKSGKD